MTCTLILIINPIIFCLFESSHTFTWVNSFLHNLQLPADSGAGGIYLYALLIRSGSKDSTFMLLSTYAIMLIIL